MKIILGIVVFFVVCYIIGKHFGLDKPETKEAVKQEEPIKVPDDYYKVLVEEWAEELGTTVTPVGTPDGPVRYASFFGPPSYKLLLNIVSSENAIEASSLEGRVIAITGKVNKIEYRYNKIYEQQPCVIFGNGISLRNEATNTSFDNEVCCFLTKNDLTIEAASKVRTDDEILVMGQISLNYNNQPTELIHTIILKRNENYLPYVVDRYKSDNNII